jgi:DNA polymerase-3 subunit epsilon
MPAIVLDTETTGFSPSRDRIIELAIIDFDTGEKIFYSRFNPNMPIPAEASRAHGITDNDVIGAPDFSSALTTLLPILEMASAVIGYNTAFDKRMLDGEFARHGINIRWPVIVCGLRTWEAHEKRDRSLTHAYKRFVDHAGFEGAHSALTDAEATRLVMKRQIEIFKLTNVSWSEFDPEKALWWGPSPHFLLKDDELIINFGKSQGLKVTEVDPSYWEWVTKKDFPQHVQLLAVEMFLMRALSDEEKISKVKEWRIAYEQKNERGEVPS